MVAVSMTFPQSQRCCFSLNGVEQTSLCSGYTHPEYKNNPFRLLELLLMHSNRIVSLQDILEYLYPNPDTQPLTWKNCVTVYTVKLRKAGIPITTHNRRGLSLNNGDETIMAGLDPWSYAEKTRKEHAEQVALFMWANMARLYGPIIADDPNSYNVKGFAKTQFEGNGGLGYKKYAAPLPQLKWLHAVHNQGHGDAVRGSQAKAEGVKAGVADIFLPVARFWNSETAGGLKYAGLYIELKKKDAGNPSDVQLEFQADMQLAGYKAEIIHGWELARDEILRYLGVG